MLTNVLHTFPAEDALEEYVDAINHQGRMLRAGHLAPEGLRALGAYNHVAINAHLFARVNNALLMAAQVNEVLRAEGDGPGVPWAAGSLPRVRAAHGGVREVLRDDFDGCREPHDLRDEGIRPLTRTIPTEESLQIEFKSDRAKFSDRDIVLTVVCLANTEGGDVYLGVEDDGSVTGLHPEHREEARLAASIASRTSPRSTCA
nr:ATP-binding protein [Deltaproteobacteria bacterium]